MRWSLRRFLLFPSLTCLLACASFAAAASGDDWRAVDPAELASKTPVVDKDADAEAIFWEVRVADEIEGGSARKVLSHYIRIKIFTDRGRESQSRIDIPFTSGASIKDVFGRTVKPDGSIIEVKKEDVYERTIVKTGGLRVKVKSFALPGVEPGAIIEYRWRETWENISVRERFELQRDIPVQTVRYFLKPAHPDSYTSVGMNAKTFHGETTPFVKMKDGFYMTSMSNVPAFHEEARMPPGDEVRAWMLVWYTDESALPPEKYWPKLGREEYEGYKANLKVSDDVRSTAAQAIGDATTAQEKLQRLYSFCQTKIKNTGSETLGLTPDERAKLKENKTPSDTLKHGIGTGWDIDLLFTALANAAGFDARVARLPDRGRYFFNVNFPNSYFLRNYDIAVHVGDAWRFFDPGSQYISFDMLRWQEEGQKALVLDPKEPFWVQTPMSPPERTQQLRRANLRLSEDGAIEGDVRVEYTGHFAVERKRANDQDSADKREENLRDEIKALMSTAEISKVKIENVTDPARPFICSYHIKVAGYAQRTGKRLFLQPEFFEHGIAPLFATTDRHYPVYFHYPWMETDEVQIELPNGYTLDSPDAPLPFKAGVVSQYEPRLSVTADGKTLVYQRKFFFGGGGNILFPPQGYAQLKGLFDELNKRDNHTIPLKQGAAGPSK